MILIDNSINFLLISKLCFLETNLNTNMDTNNNSLEKKSDINREETPIIIDNQNDIIQNIDNDTKSFANAFTLPHKYLPQKKKIKLSATGKPKLPVAGTSDEWWKLQCEKEQEKSRKEEKIARKKELQEQKRKLVEEKKKLHEKVKEIQQKIKTECS